MDGWMDGWMEGLTDGWTDGWTDRQTETGENCPKKKVVNLYELKWMN